MLYFGTFAVATEFGSIDAAVVVPDRRVDRDRSVRTRLDLILVKIHRCLEPRESIDGRNGFLLAQFCKAARLVLCFYQECG